MTAPAQTTLFGGFDPEPLDPEQVRMLAEWHGRTWPKCTAGVPDSADVAADGIPLDQAPRVSHGAGTDVRAWWPGCRDHEPDVAADQFRCRPSDDARPLP